MTGPKLRTILIVDDEESLREVIRDCIESTQIRVLEAKNGVEALAILEKQKVDLIISDIDMPVKTGIEFLRDFRLNDKQTPVVIITGGTKFSEKEVLLMGANFFACKPNIPIEKILKMVA